MRIKFLFLMTGLMIIPSLLTADNLCDDSDKSMEFIASESNQLMKDFKIGSDQNHWTRLGSLVKQTVRCLDGGNGEHVSGAAESGLANDWDGFVQYVNSGADPRTVDGIVKLGVSDMTMTADLAKIKSRARTKCPEKLAESCQKIIAFKPAESDDLQ